MLGKYTLSDNQINFTPDIPKQVFTVLGRKKTTVKSGVKLTFASGFLNDGPTYIKFDDDSLMNIFEKDDDGGKPYYVIKLAQTQHDDRVSKKSNLSPSRPQWRDL